MGFYLADIFVVAFAGLVCWWLSGYDRRLTGENEKADRVRRCIRCGVSLVLVHAAFWCLWQYYHYNDRACGWGYLTLSLLLALSWIDCIAEMSASGFQSLIDPEDKREFDGKKQVRDLDELAALVRNGRKREAIELCQALKESGGASTAAMETMLEHLGVPQNRGQKFKPLGEAARLREQGYLREAELILKSLLLENPCNVDAAFMLMRLYAEDLKRDDKAHEVLRTLKQQPYISAAHIEYAHRSIHEWQNSQPAAEVVEALPESVDELLAQSRFGTAIEILETKIRAQPDDVDSRLKLAEVHARYCNDFPRAEKMLRQMEAEPAFDPERIRQASVKLMELRAARR